VRLDNSDVMASLQALPETDPVEVEGIQLAGTCACVGASTLLQTACTGVSCPPCG
jgi:hypothetical protein